MTKPDSTDARSSGELSQFDNTDILQPKESVVEQLRKLSRKHDDALTESEQAALECAGKWIRSIDGFANE
jgi:hypothetical protein